MVREMSQRHAVHGDMIGMPDVIAWRHGVTLLVECKKPGGRLRASQRIFAEEIARHLSRTLRYIVTNDLDQFGRWLERRDSDHASVGGDDFD